MKLRSKPKIDTKTKKIEDLVIIEVITLDCQKFKIYHKI